MEEYIPSCISLQDVVLNYQILFLLQLLSGQLLLASRQCMEFH
jgi:hypothetical protein